MDVGVIGVFVPIVAIVCGVVVAVAWIYASHRQRMQRADFRHRERLAAIEKGLELPPDPIEVSPPTPIRRPRHLLRGLVLLFGGVALTVALGQDHEEAYLFGLLPAAIGLAYLLYYFVEGRRESQRALGDPPAGTSSGS